MDKCDKCKNDIPKYSAVNFTDGDKLCVVCAVAKMSTASRERLRIWRQALKDYDAKTS